MSDTLIAAGRDLDARIARLMGYTNLKKVGDSWWGVPPEPCEYGMRVPHYSTYMGDTWRVWIEMLTRVGHCEIIGDMENFCDGPGDIVTVSMWDGKGGAFTVTGDAPWAICNCALLVLGEITL
jgi:hypothetical protein